MNRIALLAPGWPTEAQPYAYAFVHARARLYQDHGHEVRAFAPGEHASYELDGIRVVRTPVADLAAEIRRYRPTVLATHAPNFRTIPVARGIDCRQVAWVHGHEALFNLHSVDYARTAGERLAKWAKVVPRNLVQLATLRAFLSKQDAVVFVSDWIRRAAARNTLLHPPHPWVIPNPVDTRLFSYRFDPSRRTLGLSARSLERKVHGFDLAVRAFGRVEGATLTLVGRGAQEAPLRTLIRRTRSRTTLQCRHVPHREMPGLLGAFGFFVAPSRAETQGVAMCEAMSCGLPVVATRVGGIPEYVGHEETGLLVPPEDVGALAGAVQRLVDDPALHRRLSEGARLRMERQVSAEVVIPRELAVLEGP